MEYHIKTLGTTCAGTGTPLTPGTVVYSVVVERDGDLARLDFSESGWKGPPPDTVAQWKCVVPYPVVAQRKALDPEALMSYFEQLTEEANPVNEKLRYLLAMWLLRKRRLKLESSRDDGDDEILIFTNLQGVGSYEVRDPHPTEAEMAELQELLNAHLAAGWNAAA